MTIKEYAKIIHTPSLVRNGSFSRGMSFWFGCYSRHEHRSYLDINYHDSTWPRYAAQITRAKNENYPDGVDPGLHQFIDHPNLYSYPARRRVGAVRFVPVSKTAALIYMTSASTVDGVPAPSVGAGYFDNSDKDFITKTHPFTYRGSDGEVAVSAGSAVEYADYSIDSRTGSYRAGRVIPIVNLALNTSHDVLELSDTQSKIESIISNQNSGVSLVEVTNVSTNSATVVITAGSGLIPSLQRGLDTGSVTGIRSGDIFRIYDKTDSSAATITSVSTSGLITTLSIAPLANYGTRIFTFPTKTGKIQSWEIFVPSTGTAVVIKPVFEYDFTLAYTYVSAGALQGPPPEIYFYRDLEKASLRFKRWSPVTGPAAYQTVGNGYDGLSIPISTADDRSISLFGDHPSPQPITNSRWQESDNWSHKRRISRFFRESKAPIDGRLTLSLVPGLYESRVRSSVWPGGGHVANPYMDYEAPIIELVRFANLDLPGPEPRQPMIGCIFTLTPTGINSTSNRAVNLKNIVVGSDVAIYRRTESLSLSPNYFSSTPGISNFLASSAVGGKDATYVYKVKAIVSPQTPNASIYSPFILSTGPGFAWVSIILGKNNSSDFQQQFPESFNSPESRVLYLANLPIGSVQLPYPNSTTAHITSLQPLSPIGRLSEISDVVLFKGNRSQEFEINDVASAVNTYTSGSNAVVYNEVRDDLRSGVDIIDSVIPPGVSTLYAGGGVCPPGFKMVDGFASSVSPGVELFTLPSPTSVTYDDVNNRTSITWTATSLPTLLTGFPVELPELTEYIEVYAGSSVVPIPTAPVQQIIQPGISIKSTEYSSRSTASMAAFGNQAASIMKTDIYGKTPSTDFEAIFEDRSKTHLVTDLKFNFSQSPVSGAVSVNQSALPFNPSRSVFGSGPSLQAVDMDISYPSIINIQTWTAETNSQESSRVPPGPGRNEQTAKFKSEDTQYGFGIVTGTVMARVLDDNETKTIGMECSIGWVTSGGAPTSADNYLRREFALKMRVGDVYFVRYSKNPASDAIVPGTGGYFFARVSTLGSITQESNSGTRKFRLIRYDTNTWGDYLMGTYTDSGEFFDLEMRPAKLYGIFSQSFVDGKIFTPGTSTVRRIVTDSSGNSLQVWLTTDAGKIDLTAVVHGHMKHTPGSRIEVYPSGYLGAGKKSHIDYGTGGHGHRLVSESDLSVSNLIPRVDEVSGPGKDAPWNLVPANHNHGYLEYRWPMPAFNMFSVCEKL